jgi:hypothetical protein
VAVNPQRGTGTTPQARLELLRQALETVRDDGPTVYLATAGFLGCVTPAGDSLKNLLWPGNLDLEGLNREIGDLAVRLPKESLLGVGVEPSGRLGHQWLWWYTGRSCWRRTVIIRAETAMRDRLLELCGFRFLGFVCGEPWDGGSGFNLALDTAGVDVVLDAAHASINRWRDRAAQPARRCAFQRMFLRLGEACGGILAQAHEADAGAGLVRRLDNWVVYRGELPFPEVEVRAIGG